MRVVRAEVMGFCGGVRRAVQRAATAARHYGGVQSEGPVVHNPQAVEELSKQGVVVSPDLSLGHPILIRAHGVPVGRLAEWRGRGLRIIDATCPNVAANQRLARETGAAGERVVFAGDPEHAEARAVMDGVDGGVVVSTVEELSRVDFGMGRWMLMAQTTFSAEVFQKMSVLAEEGGGRVVDTICAATRERQMAAERLVGEVDVVVVVGGRESANTRRLAETVERVGGVAFRVEGEWEVLAGDFVGCSVVGVTSGASTPDWVTEGVCECLARL